MTQRTLIKNLAASADGPVSVSGWVDTVRDQKKVQFVVLRDESGAVQLVNPRATDDEGTVIPHPLADTISGLAQDEARLSSLRTTMRSICAGGVLLGVIAILVMVMRRGLASAKEAREVLLEAGDETADDARARRRSWLTVTGFVAAIGLAILLGAAFLVARPLFMG